MTNELACSCAMCKGTGKFRLYHPAKDDEHSSSWETIQCPWCGGAGFTEKKLEPMRELARLMDANDPRDALQRSHEDGDADGMGGCRAVLVAFAFIIGICVVVWLLTLPAPSLISD